MAQTGSKAVTMLPVGNKTPWNLAWGIEPRTKKRKKPCFIIPVLPHGVFLRGKGFTLFEILVTFTLTALMIGLALFMLHPNLEKYRIKKFLSTFHHELTIAHGLALQTGKRTLFYIDPETRSFWADNRKRHNIPEDIEVRGENLKIGAGEKTTVVFYPDGSCGGGILFLKCGEKLWECVLNPATGVSIMHRASS